MMGSLELLAAELRRSGLKVSSGPWTICANPTRAAGGRLVLAVGRSAGRAVCRSRVRRLARDVFRNRRNLVGNLDCLLLVRSNVSGFPRRKIRADLAVLVARVPAALMRREARADARA